MKNRAIISGSFLLSAVVLFSSLVGCGAQGSAGGNPPAEYNKSWTAQQKDVKAKREAKDN
jgi:hypothetical protein